MAGCFNLEFNNKGKLVKAVDAGGKCFGGKKKELRVEDAPQGKILDVANITIVRTNPGCCWVRVGRRWVCLPC